MQMHIGRGCFEALQRYKGDIMILTTLVENKSAYDTLGAEHGLSLFLQTQTDRILFDMGKSELFLRNAESLGLALDRVEIAIVSHGHYDHGGGLFAFLNCNKKAPVYIREQAFESHYSERVNDELADIGLDKSLLDSGRFVFTKEIEEIGTGLTLFSHVTGRDLFSQCNATLLMRKGASVICDDFLHEQNLILEEGKNAVLIAGCAHCGIVNILRRAESILCRMPDIVVGGFHLQSASAKKTEPEARVRAIGEVLLASGAVFYTGHCTGDEPFEILHEMLGDRIRPLHTGTKIHI